MIGTASIGFMKGLAETLYPTEVPCANAKRKPGYWKMDLSFDENGYPTLAPRYIKDVTSLTHCLCKNCDGKYQVVTTPAETLLASLTSALTRGSTQTRS